MTEDDDIVLALQLRDPALTERLTELLGAVPGLRLVGPGAGRRAEAGAEPADRHPAHGQRREAVDELRTRGGA